MGGKRKKPQHERAGWKEMDENKGRKRGRGKPEDDDGDNFLYPEYDETFRTMERGPISGETLQTQSTQHSMGMPSDLELGMGLDGSGTLERDLADARAELGISEGLYNPAEASSGIHLPTQQQHAIASPAISQPDEGNLDDSDGFLTGGRGRGSGKMR